MPFLNQQGINKIDYALAFNHQKNLSDRISSNSTEIQPFGNIVQIKIKEQIWLFLKNNQFNQTNTAKLPKTVSVLLWSGKYLNPKWLEAVKPKVAIAISRSVDSEIKQQLKQRGIQLYWTGRDGAIRWRRDRGFETMIDSGEREID